MVDPMSNDRPTDAFPGTVVVTGGSGYVGSLLVRRLLARSYRVRVADALLYGDRSLRPLLGHPALELVVADLRHPAQVASAIGGADAVIHLAGLVGDPACALDPAFTLAVNEDATRHIAAACAAQGVHRLLFASSCSVYGASNDLLTETSALNPVSLYARTKIASEQLLLSAPASWPAPVVLRFATIYGLSARPRFDLAVNLLTAKAVTDGCITVHGGDQWRPFVHVDDVGRALLLALEAPIDLVAGQTFNVGADDQNLRLRDLGRLIQRAVPSATIETETGHDRRNYRVDFAKIRETLGFRPDWRLEDGIGEIQAAIKDGAIADYRDPRYDNHRFLAPVLGAGGDPIGPRANPRVEVGGDGAGTCTLLIPNRARPTRAIGVDHPLGSVLR